ncbi:MAG: hypothetical protein AAF810_16325 [Cyanobacteria bacterium P01_D01_bin.36]
MTLSPLQRLQVDDGMLITADHWQLAHQYHRQRQTIHYESLHKGGIVSGLGVSVGPIPEEASNRYRQPRWLTIQPGLAIDNQGNPIVVAQTECCYVSAQPTKQITIYIVLRHSERITQSGVGVVQEAFQILEKDSPPQVNEVELCRLVLLPEAEANTRLSHTGVTAPQDVFKPGAHELDLRFRQPLRSQPQKQVTVSGWSGKAHVRKGFSSLLNSLQGLYPSLAGEWSTNLIASDLGHIPHAEFCRLDRSEQRQLGQHLQQGGVLIIEATNKALGELLQVEAELSKALAGSKTQQKSDLQHSAEQELHEIRSCIQAAAEGLAQPLRAFMDEQQLPMEGNGELVSEHPVRSHPFLFSQLPMLTEYPIGLYIWGGLVLVIGPLTQAWEAPSHWSMSRETLRGAQELGINLLHFAARRRQMQQFLNADTAKAQMPLTSDRSSQEASR